MARRRPALKVARPAPPEPITERLLARELGEFAYNLRCAVRILDENRLVEHILSHGRRSPEDAEVDAARYHLAVATLTATGKRLFELVDDTWGA